MSIGPAAIATPLIQAPVTQMPANLSAGSGGGPSQAEFSSALDNAAANPPPQVALEPKPLAQGLIASHNRLGDQVLNGLQKLGKSVEAMGSFGATPHGAKVPSAAKPSPSAAPSQTNPATQDFNSNLRDMQAMWEGGMQRQKQLYQTVFEFQVVQESAQSMMKSLKSLLTQGGG